jgi:hypothetical protein
MDLLPVTALVFAVQLLQQLGRVQPWVFSHPCHTLDTSDSALLKATLKPPFHLCFEYGAQVGCYFHVSQTWH